MPVMRCLVVYCHPVPESFGAAVRDAALSALAERGFEVRLVDLYAEGFEPVLRSIEIFPDPRVNGLLPAGAAPHVPIIR